MVDDWYFAHGSQQQGPVTWEALQAMARAGQIGPQTLVWMASMPQWQPAATVPGLIGGAPPPMYAAPAGFAPQPAGGINYYNPAFGTVAFAGFWLRFCAYVVDWLIVGLPFYIVQRMFTAPPPVYMPGRSPALPSMMLLGSCGLSLIQIVGALLYYAMMESSSKQATLGKIALGLKVTDGAGQPISFGRATGRHFAKIISVLTFFIGFMMAGWTQRKQALHDMIADTLVIRA